MQVSARGPSLRTASTTPWKSQMLINVVKVRYGDAPVFLDVASVIESYELTCGHQAIGT